MNSNIYWMLSWKVWKNWDFSMAIDAHHPRQRHLNLVVECKLQLVEAVLHMIVSTVVRITMRVTVIAAK